MLKYGQVTSMNDKKIVSDSFRNPYIPLLINDVTIALSKEIDAKVRDISSRSGISYSYVTELLLRKATSETDLDDMFKDAIQKKAETV